jgi:hypothetical protein
MPGYRLPTGNEWKRFGTSAAAQPPQGQTWEATMSQVCSPGCSSALPRTESKVTGPASAGRRARGVPGTVLAGSVVHDYYRRAARRSPSHPAGVNSAVDRGISTISG